LSAYAGVRPVIGTGILSPSKEKRDHQIWEEQGLISVSGGKLTTFRRIAQDVLRQAGTSLGAPPTRPPEAVTPGPDTAILDPVQLDATMRRRILGRYGIHAARVLECAKPGELRRISGTAMLWAEMRWAARHESVIHLEDLLLRRTRLGILAEEGGMGFREKIRAICQEEMGWSEERWEQESASYQDLWKACYCVPRE
jgi:glycerol-3-phosphate dehydrogenase